MTTLRSTNFVRTSGALERVEIYHDRIREAVAARLDPETLRRIHRRLADTLTARRIDDPEALFEHWRGAGDVERASTQAVAAARRKPPRLWHSIAPRCSIDMRSISPRTPRIRTGRKGSRPPSPTPEGRRMPRPSTCRRRRMPAALSDSNCSGRAPNSTSRRATSIAESKWCATVLAAAGMRFPRGPRQALASLLVRRARLRLRGLEVSRAPARRDRPGCASPNRHVLVGDDRPGRWSTTSAPGISSRAICWPRSRRANRTASRAGSPPKRPSTHRVGAARAPLCRPVSEHGRGAVRTRLGNPHAIALTRHSPRAWPPC